MNDKLSDNINNVSTVTLCWLLLNDMSEGGASASGSLLTATGNWTCGK